MACTSGWQVQSLRHMAGALPEKFQCSRIPSLGKYPSLQMFYNVCMVVSSVRRWPVTRHRYPSSHSPGFCSACHTAPVCRGPSLGHCWEGQGDLTALVLPGAWLEDGPELPTAGPLGPHVACSPARPSRFWHSSPHDPEPELHFGFSCSHLRGCHSPQ